jgi:hypothetical protein
VIIPAIRGGATVMDNVFGAEIKYRGTQVSVVLPVVCAGAALGVFSRRARRPVLGIAVGLGGFGGIFTGQESTPAPGCCSSCSRLVTDSHPAAVRKILKVFI